MRHAVTVALAAALGASVASGRAPPAEPELAGYLGLTGNLTGSEPVAG